MNKNACVLCDSVIMRTKEDGKLDITNYAQVAYKMMRQKKLQRLIVGCCATCFYTGLAFDSRNFEAIERSVIDGWEKELEMVPSKDASDEEKKNRYRNRFYQFKIIGVWPENGEKEPAEARL